MPQLLFPLPHYAWLYASFLAVVAVILLLDLGVFHRKAHAVGFREAAGWSIFWFAFALLCNYGFYRLALHRFQTHPLYVGIPNFDAAAEAARVGMEFLTGFVIEKALAVDNIFVFVMVFGAFGIPSQYQHRVLFLGIIGAVFFRAGFIALGSQLMAIHWVVVALGVFLILTGVKMLFIAPNNKNPSDSWQMRVLRRWLPLTSELHGQKLWIRRAGRWVGTPLLVALIFIELSDIVFAIDSVPAIFAITREPLIVFISNLLAILGLRSLYFLLAGAVDRFVYLKYGLALVLIFVGLKMAWLSEAMGGKFPVGLSLGIIAGIIGVSVAASWLATRSKAARRT